MLAGAIGGAITIIGTLYIPQIGAGIATFLSEKTSEIACEFRQNPADDDSKFTILVSRLTNDPDGSHKERVMRAFLGEKGFLVVPICESLNFDYSKDSQTATDDALQRARELIKARHADLLLFGDVRDRDKAVMIYAMNEHGGCDLRAKPTIIEHGDLPHDFKEAEKEKLIAVSLEEIASACANQSSIDWPLFAKRMTKMENLVTNLQLTPENYSHLAQSYVAATGLLYSNGEGELWFTKAENVAKNITNQSEGNKIDLSLMWNEYGILLFERHKKTAKKNDRDAAFDAYNQAIGLDPNNATFYANRGYAYTEMGDTEFAIADLDKAIGLDPKFALGFNNRSGVYLRKGDTDRAIADLDKAISLDPKYGVAYCNRGLAYLKKGDVDRAIADYDKAVSLDPKNAVYYYHRGNAYFFYKGDFDRAIDDFTKAIGLDPNLTAAYNNRGYAYLKEGGTEMAMADFGEATRLDQNSAQSYAGRGDVYWAKGEIDRAIEGYDKAIDLDAKYARAYAERGKAYRAKGDTRHAMADFDKAIGLAPKDTPGYAVRADAYRAKGDIKHAFADFRKALGLNSR